MAKDKLPIINQSDDRNHLDSGSYSLHVGNESAGKRLDIFLTEGLTHLSRSRIKTLIDEGSIEAKAGTAIKLTASRKVAEGETYIITLPEAIEPTPKAENIPLNVVFEDEYLIVIDKPAGMVVHPAPGNYDGTLVNALLHHCGDSLSGIGGVKRPGIVHRIDKDTSGLLVIAKQDIAHQKLSEVFADHSIERSYTAIVKGILKVRTGRIETLIGRHPQNRKKMAVLDRGGKRAVTHYATQEIFMVNTKPYASLVECRLETGRTHQVRVHLSHLGAPLLGDPVYARPLNVPKNFSDTLSKELSAFKRQALHASQLGFKHPISGETLLFNSSLPTDMKNLINALRNG